MDGAAAGHRITGIDDKIHDHLFQLPFVGANWWQVRVVFLGQSNLFADQPVEQMGQVLEDIVDFDNFRLERLFARKRQQLADERGGAIGVLMYLVSIRLQVCPHSVKFATHPISQLQRMAAMAGRTATSKAAAELPLTKAPRHFPLADRGAWLAA